MKERQGEGGICGLPVGGCPALGSPKRGRSEGRSLSHSLFAIAEGACTGPFGARSAACLFLQGGEASIGWIPKRASCRLPPRRFPQICSRCRREGLCTGLCRPGGSAVRPVSYTHLDVYKRQALHAGGQEFEPPHLHHWWTREPRGDRGRDKEN